MKNFCPTNLQLQTLQETISALGDAPSQQKIVLQALLSDLNELANHRSRQLEDTDYLYIEVCDKFEKVHDTYIIDLDTKEKKELFAKLVWEK
jgi:hypothetical protein